MYFNSHPLLLMNKQYEKMQMLINPDHRELVMDREAWHAAIHGITKSQTWLSDWTELINLMLLRGKKSWRASSVDPLPSKQMAPLSRQSRTLPGSGIPQWSNGVVSFFPSILSSPAKSHSGPRHSTCADTEVA